MNGKVILHENIVTESKTINIARFSKELYAIKLIGNDDKQILKFIKNKLVRGKISCQPRSLRR